MLRRCVDVFVRRLITWRISEKAKDATYWMPGVLLISSYTLNLA